MPNRYLVLALLDINPNNNIDKICLKIPLIIKEISVILQTF